MGKKRFLIDYREDGQFIEEMKRLSASCIPPQKLEDATTIEDVMDLVGKDVDVSTIALALHEIASKSNENEHSMRHQFLSHENHGIFSGIENK